MQSKKKTILAVAALVVIAAVLLLVWRAVTPKGEAGEKTITVQVLHKGGGGTGVHPGDRGRPIWARS